MSKEIISQLKELKRSHQEMNPNPDWVKRSREQLMSQVQNSMGAHPEASSFASSVETFMKLFVSQKVYYGIRTAFVFALAIGITVGGWIGGVSASHNCLPGEFCYNVKLAAEKTQVAVASVTGNTDNKIALHLEFASRRLEEIRQVKNAHQVDAVKELKKSLTSVSDTLGDVQNGDQEITTRVATDITKKTSDIARTLSDVTQSDINVPLDTVKEIADATKLVNDAGIQALGIALSGQPTGAPSEDIKALVTEKIDSILDVTKSSQVLLSDTVTSSASGTTSTLSLALPVLVLPVEVATTTPGSATTTTPTLSETIHRVDQSTQQAQVVADEAKALLQGNNVDGAFEKIKTLNIITTETRQDVVQAQETLGLQPVVTIPVVPTTPPPTSTQSTPTSSTSTP